MTTALPLLTLLAAGTAPAPATGTVDAIGAGNAEVAFAALLGARLQPRPDPGAAAPGLAIQAPTAGPAATPPLANAKNATLSSGGANAAPDPSTPPPVVLVPAGPPAPLPSESQLIQAAGGEDRSTEAAEAAVAAAIDAGIAPAPSARLVLAAALPIAVRTAASVGVLDQLLDSVLPKPPDGLARATGATAPIADGAAAPASTALFEIAELPAMTMPSAMPSAGAPRDASAGVAAPAGAPRATATIPLPSAAPPRVGAPSMTETAPAGAREAVLQAVPPAEPSGDAPNSAISLTISVRSGDAPPPLARGTSGQSPSDAPALAPGTPPKGAPAALDNGEAAPRAVEVLRRLVEPLGLNGRITIEVEPRIDPRGGVPAPVSSAHGPVAASSAAALATQGAASGIAPAQTSLGNTAHLGGATPGGGGAIAVAMGAPQGFFAQGQNEGREGWADGRGFAPASGGSDGLAAGASDDLASNFAPLLTSQSAQSAPSAAPRPPSAGAAPAMPPMPPTVTPDQLAVHIAAAARGGEQQIAVQLRPASLGRVDIQLSIGRDGAVRARVLAERHETLELLQRDAKGLEAAIEAAGLHAETGGLSFGLKDGGAQDGRSWFGEPALPASLIAALDAEPAAAAPIPQYQASPDGYALDIRV